jgi:hypothetical protein
MWIRGISFVKWKNIIINREKAKVNSCDTGRVVFEMILCEK